MKFKTITYQRVKNLGNYESERLELSVELDDDEDVDKAISKLRYKALKALDIEDNQPVF
jgi:small-conductance mechanosensitive channel